VLKPKDPDCNSSVTAAGISLLAPRRRADLDLVKYGTCCLPSRTDLSLEVNIIHPLQETGSHCTWA